MIFFTASRLLDQNKILLLEIILEYARPIFAKSFRRAENMELEVQPVKNLFPHTLDRCLTLSTIYSYLNGLSGSLPLLHSVFATQITLPTFYISKRVHQSYWLRKFVLRALISSRDCKNLSVNCTLMQLYLPELSNWWRHDWRIIVRATLRWCSYQNKRKRLAGVYHTFFIAWRYLLISISHRKSSMSVAPPYRFDLADLKTLGIFEKFW